MIADFLMRDCEPLFLNEGATRAELELKKLQALKYVVVDEDKKRLAQDSVPEIRHYAHGLRAETCILPKWEALIGRNLV